MTEFLTTINHLFTAFIGLTFLVTIGVILWENRPHFHGYEPRDNNVDQGNDQ